MKTELASTISDLKRAGYEQVSVSEIAFKTHLPKHAVVAKLNKAGLKTVIRRGEHFVSLVEMQPQTATYFSALPLKSAIFEAD